MKPNIAIAHQGKTVIEADDCGFLIMHPDGTVAEADRHEAEKFVELYDVLRRAEIQSAQF